LAHRKNIQVLPLVGPSSIVLALMSSGFNGQNFVFHGYLPIDKQERERKVKSMVQHAYSHRQTQIFMETPYRNNQLMLDLVRICDHDTLLCVACDLTLPSAFIQTHPIRIWKKNMPDLHKRPGIFLIYHP
jgi:16S rRNA (cytidine1402-2'-O)-methyltransferase